MRSINGLATQARTVVRLLRMQLKINRGNRDLPFTSRRRYGVGLIRGRPAGGVVWRKNRHR